MTAQEALDRLRAGNRRYMAGAAGAALRADPSRLAELTQGQAPFAIVLGCSDSRVPVELVFDQGLGDLFVIRVAGNIVAPSQIGSIEFAAEQFATRLVVVLGHTQCGAVLATLAELERPSADRSPNLRAIVDRIRPAVAGLLDTPLRDDRSALAAAAVRANIRAAVDQVRHGSAVIEDLAAGDGLLVVGAEYSLATGEVVFLEQDADAGAAGR